MLTADSELTFPITWLTPAGFDWDLWNASSTFGRVPPGPQHMPNGSSGIGEQVRGTTTVSLTREQVRWMLALGAIPSGGELSAFSMGSTCEFSSSHEPHLSK